MATSRVDEQAPVEARKGLYGARPVGARRAPRLLRIRGEIRWAESMLAGISTFVVLIAAWVFVTRFHFVSSLFLPRPTAVLSDLRDLARNGELWSDVGVSSFRIIVGFIIASAIALPVGVLVGTFRLWEAAIEPLMNVIRYMPVTAFVPLTILWVGIGNTQKFTIIFIGTFFQQVLMIADDVKRVPTDFIDIGRTLGLKERNVLARIVLPNAAPAIWDTMRITLGWAWTWLVLAELVAASSGLGYRITVAQRYFDTQTIIGYILVLGVLGLLTDQVMKALGKVMFRWAEAR